MIITNKTVLTENAIDYICDTLSPEEQASWVFLQLSDEYRGFWEVGSFQPNYFFDLEELIGPYRLVSPATLEDFFKLASQKGYKIAFAEDTTAILDKYAYLSLEPNVELHSALPETVKGFLPWQVVGYNKLIRDEEIKAGYVVWTTGSGKSAFIASAIKFHQEIGHPFDLAIVVVKSHAKFDTERKLKSLADIDSVILDGPPSKRVSLYDEVQDNLKQGTQQVIITNYEKFRDDTDELTALIKKRNVLLFWDEMPAKLSNRQTQLYKAVKKVLYQSFYSKPNPSWMRHWALTATPIENSPNDVFGCVNLMQPGLLGTVNQFYLTHVSSYNFFTGKPENWKNLGRLEAKLQHMTHRVSKDDPEVAALFPTIQTFPDVIDWHPRHRALYDKLTAKAKAAANGLDDMNILALIQVLQMICDAPSMIAASAANREAFTASLSACGWVSGSLPSYSSPKGSEVAQALVSDLDSTNLTDKGHSKLEYLREIITQKHPTEKVVVHSTWSSYIFPVWQRCLTEWGVSYVVFSGTAKQKQMALDAFRNDPSIRVFLSGDAGSDSIDIAEASVGINYNVPWKWTILRQREGRRDRVTSAFDTIYTYTLTMPDSVEERKQEICARKQSYHAKLFDGKAIEEMASAKMTREELLYMLFG